MKKNKKIFGIKCYGHDLFLPKDDVIFYYKFGLAKGIYPFDESGMPIVGIVDDEFNEVLPMVTINLLPRIAFFSDYNAMLLTNDPTRLENPNESYHLFKEDDEYQITPLGCKDFIAVNNTTAVLVFAEGGEDSFVIYDLETRQYLTPFINALSQFYFDEQIGEDIAEAVITLPYPDGSGNNFAHFLINTRGKVKSPIKDTDTGKTYESDDLVATIHLIYEDMSAKKAERSRVKLDCEANK